MVVCKPSASSKTNEHLSITQWTNAEELGLDIVVINITGRYSDLITCPLDCEQHICAVVCEDMLPNAHDIYSHPRDI